jgi:hypothetical protein
MPDRQRFDPIGWFAGACVGLLFGAVALVIAVHLIREVWPWLVGIVAVAAGVGLGVRAVVAWHRRRPW